MERIHRHKKNRQKMYSPLYVRKVIKETIANNLFKIVSISFFVFGYMCYYWGYGMISGYYFGTEVNLLSAIPIDFTTLAILGAIIFVIGSLMIISVYLFLLSKSLFDKFFSISFHIIIIYMCVLIGEIKIIDLETERIVLILLVFSMVCIYCGVLMQGMIIHSSLGIYYILYALVYIIAYIFVMTYYNINPNSYAKDQLIISYIICYMLIIVPLLLMHLSLVKILSTHPETEPKRIGQFLIKGFPYAFIISSFMFPVISKLKILGNISGFLVFGGEIIIGMAISLIGYFIHKYRKKKVRPIKSKTINKHHDENKMGKFYIVIGTMSLFFIATFLLMFKGMVFIGDQIGKQKYKSQNSISYYKMDGTEFEIEGTLVAQKGNTYYISTKERQLLIINTNNIKIESNAQ